MKNKINKFIINKYNFQLYNILLKINKITKHLLNNKKDYNSKKFLFIYINKKKKIIYYYKKNKKFFLIENILKLYDN
ncbi:MAG: 30S ribosomal protein S15 [Candidatus Shikimatogenerans sp. Tcar]|uniref:30S ribosomal protein S15 n=1 Tax=Candidatus Shikimatogenerans sp. Tcar TaxID=3158565 RepID=A0AAU7QS96_9FLAO